MFNQISIHQKLLIALTMIFITCASLLSSVVHIKLNQDATEKIAQFRPHELTKIEQKLMDYTENAIRGIDVNYQNANNIEYLQQQYGLRLKTIIDMAQHIIKTNITLVQYGRLTEAEAKTKAAEEIGRLRYDEGTGYIWINDMGKPYPKMIMHPIDPTLNGKVLDANKYNCALGIGKNLFQAAVEICRWKGEGFVDYLWPKPISNMSATDQPKLSFVRLIPEWHWMIGTGFYINDALSLAVQNAIQDLQKIRFNKGEGHLWIIENLKPFPKMVMHPSLPHWENRLLDSPKFQIGPNDQRNLYQVIIEQGEINKEGFIEHTGVKPEKTESSKLSYTYFKRYAPLNWTIGASDDISYLKPLIEKRITELNWEISDLLRTIWYGTGIIFLLSIGIFWLIIQTTVIKPINSISHVIHRISEGWITDQIELNRNDEIGRFGQVFNMTMAKLRRIMDNISETCISLLNSAKLLTKTSESMTNVSSLMKTQSESVSLLTSQLNQRIQNIAASATDVSNQVADVANASASFGQTMTNIGAGISTVSADLTNVASSAQQVSSSISIVATAIEEMYASLNHVSKNAATGTIFVNETAQQAVMTSDVVHSLGTAADEIGDVVALINSIAAQTNLLALNATIEAANAGNKGSGFAVVANEIKELSRQTGRSTEEIHKRIKRIQLNTQSAITAIELITGGITEVNRLVTSIATEVEEQTATTNEIAKSVTKAASASSLLSHKVNDAATGANEIVKHVHNTVTTTQIVTQNISTLAGKTKTIANNASLAASETKKISENASLLKYAAAITAEGAAETDASAISLTSLAEKLKTIVSFFKPKPLNPNTSYQTNFPRRKK